MNKLLLMGDIHYTKELIIKGKELGAYVILTDNRSTEESPDKLLADEYWDIGLDDLDALEDKARENGVTHVYAGASDICITRAMELSERLGLDFYCTREICDLIVDKRAFKKKCVEYGVPVAKEYELHDDMTEDELNAITYPIIIKPVNGSSSLGISICHNASEVPAGYKKAKTISDDVFAESYIEGIMVCLYYAFDAEGKARLFLTYDDKATAFFVTPSAYHETICAEISPKIEKMFSDLGINRGVGFVQMMIAPDGQAAVLEMNYRLCGALATEAINLVLAEIVLRDAFGMTRYVPDLKLALYAFAIMGKEGTIDHFEGLDKVEGLEQHLFTAPWKKPGDSIENGTGLRQLCFELAFKGNDKSEQREMLRFIYENIRIVGTNGEDLMIRNDLFS